MLRSFVENGALFNGLPTKTVDRIERQFLLYLLHIISFNAACANCNEIVDQDRTLARIIRERMAALIGDHGCNAVFKPAFIQYVAGNQTAMRGIGVSQRAYRKTAHESIFRPLVRKTKFPIHIIGPQHIGKLEASLTQKVEKHAMRFVRYRAAFLTRGDSGIDSSDMATDLLALSLRALRRYYPFRSEPHLLNSMRQTITVRGRSAIKHETALKRRRVYTDDAGVVQNFESSAAFDFASNSLSAAYSPQIMLDIKKELERQELWGCPVAGFLLSPEQQDRFVEWMSIRFPNSLGASDITESLRMAGASYPKMLAHFLGVEDQEVKQSFRIIRKAMI